jgi:hypothetical protein
MTEIKNTESRIQRTEKRGEKRQKNTPGSYLHGGISESKKKEN